MAKTFHHLVEGSTVTVQLNRWLPNGGVEILEEVQGRVLEVLRTRVSVQFPMRVWDTRPWDQQDVSLSVQHFSRRSGLRWGSGPEDYRIHPDHAR